MTSPELIITDKYLVLDQSQHLHKWPLQFQHSLLIYYMALV